MGKVFRESAMGVENQFGSAYNQLIWILIEVTCFVKAFDFTNANSGKQNPKAPKIDAVHNQLLASYESCGAQNKKRKSYSKQ